MRLWKTNEELFEVVRRELFTAVVGDAMDRIGLDRQFLPPQIRALATDMVVIGPAMTVVEADVTNDNRDVTPFDSSTPLMISSPEKYTFVPAHRHHMHYGVGC